MKWKEKNCQWSKCKKDLANDWDLSFTVQAFGSRIVWHLSHNQIEEV